MRASTSSPAARVSRPSTITSPLVGIRIPLKVLASVVLPAPFCPTKATNSPREMLQLTWWSAAVEAPSYWKETSRTSMMGASALDMCCLQQSREGLDGIRLGGGELIWRDEALLFERKQQFRDLRQAFPARAVEQLRIPKQLPRRALGNDLPLIYHQDTIGKLGQVLDGMFDHNDGGISLVPQPAHGVEYFLFADWIEFRG